MQVTPLVREELLPKTTDRVQPNPRSDAPQDVMAFDDSTPSYLEVKEQPIPEPEVSIVEKPFDENTSRFLDIDELYEALSLKSNNTDTIYLIEEYLETLPDTLPDDSRRDIVSKIVAASGFDYDLLMGDGILRVKMLKEYAEKFARSTDDFISNCQLELRALEDEITRVQKLITDRRELHRKQFLAIEAEANRLKGILAFIQ